MRYFEHEMECSLLCFGDEFCQGLQFLLSKTWNNWQNLFPRKYYASSKYLLFKTASCVTTTKSMQTRQSSNKTSIQWIFRQFIHCRCWWCPILKINLSIKHGLKIHSQDPTSVSTIKMLSLSKSISKPICAYKNTFASASTCFKAVSLTMIIAIIIIIFII